MNVLGYKSDDKQYFSFELLVDGKPLGELTGSQHQNIPYWIFEDDLPYFPPHSPEFRTDEKIRIVTVCGCGEYGCGHTQCRVVREGNEVIFIDFHGDLTPRSEPKVFRFIAENYDNVIAAILKEVREREAKERA